VATDGIKHGGSFGELETTRRALLQPGPDVYTFPGVQKNKVDLKGSLPWLLSLDLAIQVGELTFNGLPKSAI